jgi:hypothetical protein
MQKWLVTLSIPIELPDDFNYYHYIKQREDGSDNDVVVDAAIDALAGDTSLFRFDGMEIDDDDEDED